MFAECNTEEDRIIFLVLVSVVFCDTMDGWGTITCTIMITFLPEMSFAGVAFFKCKQNVNIFLMQ